MTHTLFEKLAGIDHVLVDIDHVINHYDSDFARQFSVATAECFANQSDEGARYDLDELTMLSVQSYAEYGRTTALFAKKFGIAEMSLYIDHHNDLCEENGFIHTQFRMGKITTDPELPTMLAQVRNLGVRLHAFTNGTENYARTVLGARVHNVSHYFNTIIGMDSLGSNKDMKDKRHPAHIRAALKKIGCVDAKRGTLIDDTSTNILSGKQVGLFGVLPLRKNPTSPQCQKHADLVVDDVKDFLGKLVQAKKSVQSRACRPR